MGWVRSEIQFGAKLAAVAVRRLDMFRVEGGRKVMAVMERYDRALKDGPEEAAKAITELIVAFQPTLKGLEVETMVFETPGNRWLFSISHPDLPRSQAGDNLPQIDLFGKPWREQLDQKPVSPEFAVLQDNQALLEQITAFNPDPTLVQPGSLKLTVDQAVTRYRQSVLDRMPIAEQDRCRQLAIQVAIQAGDRDLERTLRLGEKIGS